MCPLPARLLGRGHAEDVTNCAFPVWGGRGGGHKLRGAPGAGNGSARPREGASVTDVAAFPESCCPRAGAALQESQGVSGLGWGRGNCHPEKVFRDNYTPPTPQTPALRDSRSPGNAPGWDKRSRLSARGTVLVSAADGGHAERGGRNRRLLQKERVEGEGVSPAPRRLCHRVPVGHFSGSLAPEPLETWPGPRRRPLKRTTQADAQDFAPQAKRKGRRLALWPVGHTAAGLSPRPGHNSQAEAAPGTLGETSSPGRHSGKQGGSCVWVLCRPLRPRGLGIAQPRRQACGVTGCLSASLLHLD